MKQRMEAGMEILSNFTVGSSSLVVVVGILLTLMGISEIKSLNKDFNFSEHHKKFHIILIILLIAFPSFLTLQLIRSGDFFELLAKGFWINYVLYDALAFYVLIHLREERKGEVTDNLTFKAGVLVMWKKIIDLFKF